MEVISVAEMSCLPVWRHTAPAILERIENANSFQVIVPDSQVESFKSETPRPIEVVPESTFSTEIATQLGESLPLHLKHRYGWYLQQFLKLEAVIRVSSEGGNSLIWDADTIPLRTLTFEENNKFLLFRGAEYHIPYFETIERALDLDRIEPASFVSQCLPVSNRWMLGLREELERRHGLPWWRALINSIDFDRKSGFSEYETIGTYISHNFRDEWEWRVDPWLRDGYSEFEGPSSVDTAHRALHEHFHFVAFERSELRKNRPKKAEQKVTGGVSRWTKSVRRLSRVLRKSPQANLLRWIKTEKECHLLAVGAWDSEKSREIDSALSRTRTTSITLIEPREEFHPFLEENFSYAPKIRVLKTMCGKETTDGRLFAFKTGIHGPTVGQSNSTLDPKKYLTPLRAALIHKAWHLPELEGSIESKRSKVSTFVREIHTPIQATKLLIGAGRYSALFIDAIGSEYQVVRGLDTSNLPSWIVTTHNLRDLRTRRFLEAIGYRAELHSEKLYFSLKRTEETQEPTAGYA